MQLNIILLNNLQPVRVFNLKMTHKAPTPLVIGLTGGIGSGKTAASNLFAKKGVSVIDADVLARQALRPGLPLVQEVIGYFGREVEAEDGSLDRALLRQRIFNHPEEKRWLEQRIHPWVEIELVKQLEAVKDRYCIVSSPLLLEVGQDRLVDRVLVVDLPEEIQIERTCKRDHNNPGLVEQIIKQQIGRSQRLARADDLINNSRGFAELEKQVNSLHEFYLTMARRPG